MSGAAENEESEGRFVWLALVQSCAVGALYVGTSACLIAFNKYLMRPGQFSHASVLTSIHMGVTTVMSFLLYVVFPQLYPTMPKALANWGKVLKTIAPLGVFFAIALVCSNKAYQYSSVAFLQFCKQGNVALVFAMSCCLGLQIFGWRKVGVLAVVVTGCSLCANGEIHFVRFGFFLQISSQVMECSKNLIGEMVMSGEGGLKLDVLTFVMFQAPLSLIPLLIGSYLSWTPEVWPDIVHMWPLLLGNALVAFILNVSIALTLKQLSALAFVLIGIVKDSVIVGSSAIFFGDPITQTQQMGFCITIVGMALWGRLKMREQAQKMQMKESEPLLPKTVRR
mmetsp:Transcript_104551/g.186043  ORF Transcript_104551/g.186043 Transcript_104551/m.186043 type:complete len:338 (+) Transcript_104551:73-1086(+)|eukprot:CAMPEP_0197654852 /NCGR_PEP_ID=MMETSP1338-20131121/39097_1 /TAXON_ID=43686 ORGANISM="Pelagodinium beii, Strain RCC1491" /NCGR_SAMPLE_ID=MMETSP1338 /ASSEMBLY_ACC=CAM_ASM_000754 /LENGTH=337 /DNA_ID=CAMNT_0043230375 /DNA_START=74 /DNA_END=1087 /DNA_ORIENTATION=-